MGDIIRARCCPGAEKGIREQYPHPDAAPLTWDIRGDEPEISSYNSRMCGRTLAEFRDGLAAAPADCRTWTAIHPWLASALLACGVRVETKASLFRAVRPHIPYGRRLVHDNVGTPIRIRQLIDEAVDCFAGDGVEGDRRSRMIAAWNMLSHASPWETGGRVGWSDDMIASTTAIAPYDQVKWLIDARGSFAEKILFGPLRRNRFGDGRNLWIDDMPAWPHRLIYGDALDCAAAIAEHDLATRGDGELVADLWGLHRGLATALDRRAWSSNAFLQCAFIGDWLEERGLPSQAWTYRHAARVMAGEPRPAPAQAHRRARCRGAA